MANNAEYCPVLTSGLGLAVAQRLNDLYGISPDLTSTILRKAGKYLGDDGFNTVEEIFADDGFKQSLARNTGIGEPAYFTDKDIATSASNTYNMFIASGYLTKDGVITQAGIDHIKDITGTFALLTDNDYDTPAVRIWNDVNGNLHGYVQKPEFSKSEAKTIQLTLFNEDGSDIREEHKASRPLVTKVISGVQTGVDTLGLIVAHDLGIETGGTAAPGFTREKNVDKYTREDLEKLGVVEISEELQAGKKDKEFYLPRTEQNVINSDGTVYFYTSKDQGGVIATRRFARTHQKPFIINPTGPQLRKFIIDNNIKVLNVAGNRGSKLEKPEQIERVLREGLMSAAVEGQTTAISIRTQTGETKNVEIPKQYIDEKIQEQLEALDDKELSDFAFFLGQDPSVKEHNKAAITEAFEKGLDAQFEKEAQRAEPDEDDEPRDVFRRKFKNKNMLTHLAESLVRQMSIIVNELQDDEKVNGEFPNARNIFGDDFRDVDFTQKERKDILLDSQYFKAIRNKAASRIFSGKAEDPSLQWVFDMFFGGKTKGMINGEEREVDNLSLLLQFGRTMMRRNERIRILDDGTREQVNEDEDITSDEEQEDSDSYMDGEGNGYESQEQYKLADDIRSASDKITQRIKIMLSNIMEYDLFDGEYLPISDPFGLGTPTYIDQGRAVNTLLNVLNGADTIDTMIKRLRANLDAYPWFIDVLQRIEPHENESISREKLRNEFFGSMRKDKTVFTSTMTMEREDGTIRTRYAERNRGTGSKKNKANIVAQFDSQEGLPIFKYNRIDFTSDYFLYALNRLQPNITQENAPKTILGSRRQPNLITMLSREYASDPEGLYADLSVEYLEDSDDQPKDQFETWNTFVQIYHVLKGFGVEVTPRAFYAMAIADMNSGRDDFLQTNIGRIITKLHSIAKQLNYFRPVEETGFQYYYYNPLAYDAERKQNDRDYIYLAPDYDEMLDIVGAFTESPTESMAYVDHRAHYAFNYPTFIQSTIAKLSGRYVTQDELNEFFAKRYDNDWYSYVDKGGVRHYYLDILEQIKNNGNIGNLEYMQKLDCNGIDYKYMSPKSYALSILSDYFDQRDRNVAVYRAPIASDKPAMDTIRWRRLGNRSKTSANYQTVIGTQVWKIVGQEINRSRQVLNDSINGKAPVANFGIKFRGSEAALRTRHQEIIKKIQAGENVTIGDLFVNGKYVYAKSGVGFKQVRFVQSILEGKFHTGEADIDMAIAEFRQALVDAIFNGKDSINKMSDVLATAFDWAMGLKVLSNMEYLNKIGLLELTRVEKMNPTELDILDSQGRAWTYKYKYLQSILYEFFKDTKTQGERMPETAEDLEALLEDALTEFVYNNYIMQIQMCELFGVDLAYYDGTTDFQKRMAQTRSTGQKLNKSATMFGQPISDGILRTITLESVIHKTAYEKDEVEAALLSYAKTIKNETERNSFLASIPSIVKLYEDNDATDGQAWNCLSSLRKKHHMAGKWSYSKDDARIGETSDGKTFWNEDSDSDEAVYQRIMHGHPLPKDFFHVFTQIDKPFVYDVSMRDGRPVPIQQKNSEYTHVIVNQMVSEYEPKDPLSVLISVMEDTYRINPQTGLDTANFDSVVKVGNSRSINIDTDIDTLRKNLRSILFKGIADGQNHYDPTYVTQIDVDSYAYQQNNPEHFIDHKQLLGSQEKILSVINTNDEDEFNFAAQKTLKSVLKDKDLANRLGFKLTTQKSIDGKTLKTVYFNVLAERTRLAEDILRDELALNKVRRKKLSKMSQKLKYTMSMNQKYSADDVRAVSLRKGNFVLAAEDPSQAANIKAATSSWVKKAMYRQEVLGGPIVQATGFGQSKELKTIFNNGRFDHFETIIPMPEQIRRLLRNEDGVIAEEFFDYDNGKWKFGNIKSYLRSIGASDMLKILLYRIPSEGKYSIFPCEVVGFAPDGGGDVVFLPDVGTTIAGFDFDTDKLFAIMKEYATRKDLETGKIKQLFDDETGMAIEYTPFARSKKGQMAGYNNVLFDLQWMSLTSEQSASEIFDPGNFQDLTDLSYRIELMKARDEQGQPLYRLQDIMSMPSKQLKEQWTQLNDMDPADFETMIKLHDQNMSSKEMLGIAAVSNISHAQLSMFTQEKQGKRIHQTLPYKLRLQFAWNDKSGPRTHTLSDFASVDERTNINGELISKYIRKYVGAAADAAKNPTLARLGADKVTFPVIQWLLRAGLPMQVVHLYTALPVFSRLSALYKSLSDDGKSSVNYAIAKLESTIFNENRAQFNGYNNLDAYKQTLYPVDAKGRRTARTISINEEELINMIYSDEMNAYEQIKALEDFKELSALSQKLTTLSNYGRINSVIAGPKATIEENEAIEERVEKAEALFEGMFPDFTNITFNDVVKFMPYETQMYKSIQRLLDALQGDLFPSYQSDSYNQILSLISRITGKELSADIKERINEAQKLYALSLSAYDLGDQDFIMMYDDAEAKKYLVDFPRYFVKELSEIKAMNTDLSDDLDENLLLGLIGEPMAPTATCPIETLNTSIFGADDDFKYKVTQAWQSLMSYTNKDMTKEQLERTHKLALDLFRYFTLRNRGKSFDTRTPWHLAPLDLKTLIPGYNERLKKIQSFTIPAGEFAVQFLLNNCEREDLFEILPAEDLQEFAEGYVPNSSSGELKIKPEYMELLDEDKSNFLNIVYGEESATTSVRLSPIQYLGDGKVLLLGDGDDILRGYVEVPIIELLDGAGELSTFTMERPVKYKIVHRLGIPGVIAEYYPFLKDSAYRGMKTDPKNPVYFDTDNEDAKLTGLAVRGRKITVSSQMLGTNLNYMVLESARRLGYDIGNAFTLDPVNSRISSVRAANMLKMRDDALLEALGFRKKSEFANDSEKVSTLVESIRRRLEEIC